MPATILPDLPPPSFLNSDRPHLLHSGAKRLEKPPLIPSHLLHDRPGARVQKQCLVGGQQAQITLQIPVICVIKLERRLDITRRNHIRIAPELRARHAQRLEQTCVHCGIRAFAATEIIQAIRELVTVREPDGVGARQRD